MIQGIVITGGEDSQILAWSMQEGNERIQENIERSNVHLGVQKVKNNKEDRYFKPY